MNRSHLRAVSLAALLAFSLAACGGPRGFGGGPPRDEARTPSDRELGDGAMIAKAHALVFVAMDTDADRRTSQAERDTALPRLFTQADADDSGALGGIEFSEWALAAMGSRYPLPGFAQMDTDMDQAVTRAEFTASFADLFDRYDADKDGTVTRAELLVRLDRRNGGPGGGSGPGGSGRPPGGGAPPGGPGGM